MGNKKKSRSSGGRGSGAGAGDRASKRAKMSPTSSGGSSAAFANVSMQQKNATRMKKDLARRLLKIKSFARLVAQSDAKLRRFVLNPKPVEKKGYDPAMRGMELTGPARPAADIEISDHGCGLRVFECRKRCVRDEDRPKETDMFAKFESGGRFHEHPATAAHVALLQRAGDACRYAGRTSDALTYYNDAMKLDSMDVNRVRPRAVAAAMDIGDASQARSIIEKVAGWVGSDGSRVDWDITYAWTMFLVEYISHFLLQEPGSSAELVEDALHIALNANRHVALFMSVPNLFEEVVDGDAMMRHVANHHYVEDSSAKDSSNSKNSAENMEMGSSSARATASSSADEKQLGLSARSNLTSALAYCIDQFGCWRDAGEVRDYVWKWTLSAYRTPFADSQEDAEASRPEDGRKFLWTGPESRAIKQLYKHFCVCLEERRMSHEHGGSDNDGETSSVDVISGRN